MCNGGAKQVTAGIAPCTIKGRNSLGKVETGLEMLFTWPAVAVSDWLMQRSETRPRETSFTKWCYTV